MTNPSGFSRDEWFSGAAAGYTGYPEGKPDGGNSQLQTPKKKSHSVKRSSSKNNSPKRPPLHRSTSWGNEGAFNKNEDMYLSGHHNIPAYAKGDVFDEKNLARRPLDWRPDYKPKFPSIIPGLTKTRTEVTGNVLCFRLQDGYLTNDDSRPRRSNQAYTPSSPTLYSERPSSVL